jgi:hypothetical protein
MKKIFQYFRATFSLLTTVLIMNMIGIAILSWSQNGWRSAWMAVCFGVNAFLLGFFLATRKMLFPNYSIWKRFSEQVERDFKRETERLGGGEFTCDVECVVRAVSRDGTTNFTDSKMVQ